MPGSLGRLQETRRTLWLPRSVHIVLGLREGFKEAALASFRLLAY